MSDSDLSAVSIEQLAPDALTPNARNSRTHSKEQLAQIAASIEEFGFTNPVLITDDNTIIAGHGRVLAAEKIGLATVPCLRLDHLSDTQIRAYVIADNKIALNAGWDDQLLALELGELIDRGYGTDLTGFSEAEVAELVVGDVDEQGLTDDDSAPAAADPAISRAGDVWVLGRHRVMCGDSTSRDQVASLCSDGDIDGVWMDPPYNVGYETKAGKIQNDDLGDDAFAQFLQDAFDAAYGVMNAGASIYIAHADSEGRPFRTAFARAGFKTSAALIWVKPQLVLGRSDYQWRHESILYGWKTGAAHRWFGGRKQTTVFEAADAPYVIDADGGVQIEIGETTLRLTGTDLKVEELVGSVLRAEKPARSAEHPTMKPVDLIVRMVKNSTRPGDTVLDLFGGAGSTLIACQKSGRAARLMEIDPRYCDVIGRRWQDFTGQAGVRAADGQRFDAVTGATEGA